MKRFIFAHFIALFAFFPQLLSAQTSFGWGSTYEKDTDPVALLRKANDLLWKLSK